MGVPTGAQTQRENSKMTIHGHWDQQSSLEIAKLAPSGFSVPREHAKWVQQMLGD